MDIQEEREEQEKHTLLQNSITEHVDDGMTTGAKTATHKRGRNELDAQTSAKKIKEANSPPKPRNRWRAPEKNSQTQPRRSARLQLLAPKRKHDEANEPNITPRVQKTAKETNSSSAPRNQGPARDNQHKSDDDSNNNINNSYARPK